MAKRHIFGNVIKYLCVLMFTAFSDAKPPSDAQEQLNAMAQNYSGGMALGWVDEDGISFLQTGQFSAEDPRPITPDTKFEIGSVTKVFTALLLSECERRGIVSSHDPAAKYLLHPNDPDQASLAKITLHSLTTHTSGLPRMPSNFGNDSDGVNFARYDRAMLIEALRTHGPYAPVGLKVVYSNFGVALLGEALGSACGMSYEAALETYILGPLGLNDTTLAITGKPEPPMFPPPLDNNTEINHWTFLSFAAAGALLSSSGELVRFMQAALWNNDTAPLHEAFLDTTKSRQAVQDMGLHYEVALGWFIFRDEGREIFFHDGGTGGCTTFLGISRREEKGIVLLSNNGENINNLGFRLLGVDALPQTSWAVECAFQYTGVYWITEMLAINITEVDGELYEEVSGTLQGVADGRCYLGFKGQNYFAPGLQKRRLREIGKDHFSIIYVPVEISFHRDGTGRVGLLRLDQESCGIIATRDALSFAMK